MARPEKDTEIKRSHHITLRLSDAEFELITRVSYEAGLSRSA